ncbi:MAG: adenylate/guanylate cyclase domain-containing protein [Thermoleophilaceae bacterium]
MGTATTAALTDRRRGERLKSVRRAVMRAIGPCIGGAPGSIERRAFWRFALVIPIANLAGAFDVFAFLWKIAPTPSDVANPAHVQHVNTVVFLITMVVTFFICGSISNRVAEPIANWLDSGEPADEAMVRRVLRNPLRQALISGGTWVLCAIEFAILNWFYSPALGVEVGLGILLGGITTCGMMYLLAEKAMHPITVRALSSAAPRKPALPGVDARMLIIFAVTIGGPLVATIAFAVMVMGDASVTRERLALTVLVLALAALVAGLLAMKLMARSLALPLRSVRDALARVERGDLAADVRVDDGSEVGVLQAGFNSMVAGLREREQLRDLFGRHVGEHVANSAIERGGRLGGELRQAAVMFVDVIGSTSLAAERAPDDVVALLNRFFGLVVEVTSEHSGWVNKFEGDGCMCVFGAPGDLDDPAGCALRAARALDERLRRELPELEAGIGVSAGTVVAGNVGSAERYEYTLIGDPVNEASRLTQLAKETPARILASAATLARARDPERTSWRADGEATLRGRPRPTKLVIPSTLE